ncbi:hypothetical protein RGUI_2219 [Rhodovulum sp. P5]|nr:hypothetical protein RGUI_2219 [Rhodovulum sp. P5]
MQAAPAQSIDHQPGAHILGQRPGRASCPPGAKSAADRSDRLAGADGADYQEL